MADFGKMHWVTLSLLLGVATLLSYNPIIHNQFIDFDNAPYILQNPQVQNGLTWETVKWSFTTFHAGYWHPLTWLSHAADCQMFHLNPVGHHYTNLLLHTLNAILLFLLLRGATGRTSASLFVAALFALHPVNVESVAWAAERKNVLSMCFFLLAMLAYDRYARDGRGRSYLMVVILFAFGLMAKPQIVTLPFVLLLWDYWPLGRLGSSAAAGGRCRARSLRWLVTEKVPLFVLAAAGSVMAVIAQRAGNAVRTVEEVSWPVRLENIFVSYVRYVGKALWPSHLVPMYPRPVGAMPGLEVGAAVTFLLLITLLVVHWRERRYLAVGWFWFLGTSVPMIGIVTVGEQAMADRFAYIPMIGLFIAIVWSLDALASRYEVSGAWCASAAGCALLVLGCLTYHQVGYWHDDETLWRYTLSNTDGNYMAHDNLAIALSKQGRADEAVLHFRAAEAFHHYPAVQVLSLALYEMRFGHSEEAIQDCESVLSSSADRKVQAVASSEIGLAELQLRRYDLAEERYRSALVLNPDEAIALMGTGILDLRDGQPDAAVRQLVHAVNVDPSEVNILLLAQALRRAGRNREADSAIAQLQRISNSLNPAQEEVGQLLSFAGLKPI